MEFKNYTKSELIEEIMSLKEFRSESEVKLNEQSNLINQAKQTIMKMGSEFKNYKTQFNSEEFEQLKNKIKTLESKSPVKSVERVNNNSFDRLKEQQNELNEDQEQIENSLKDYKLQVEDLDKIKKELQEEMKTKDELIMKFNEKIGKSKEIQDDYINKVEEKYRQSINDNEQLQNDLVKKDDDLNKALALLENMSTKMNDLATDNQSIYNKQSEALQSLETMQNKHNELSGHLEKFEQFEQVIENQQLESLTVKKILEQNILELQTNQLRYAKLLSTNKEFNCDQSVFDKVKTLIDTKEEDKEADTIEVLELIKEGWSSIMVMICQISDLKLQQVFDEMELKTSDTERRFDRIHKQCKFFMNKDMDEDEKEIKK